LVGKSNLSGYGIENQIMVFQKPRFHKPE